MIYVNTNFKGHWPVGTVAVVIADSQEKAAEILSKKLSEAGLEQGVPLKDMRLLEGDCEILADGNY